MLDVENFLSASTGPVALGACGSGSTGIPATIISQGTR